MARRAEDVEAVPMPEWLERSLAQADRGEFVPWEEIRPRLSGTLAASRVHLRARAAAGIPEGVLWTPPPEVQEEMRRAREAAYAADAAGAAPNRGQRHGA